LRIVTEDANQDALDEPVKTAAELLADAQGKSLPPVVVPMTNQERLALMRNGKRRKRGNALASEKLRGEIVRHRIAGLKYDEIGQLVDLSPSACRKHVDKWVMEQTPAPDQADALRHVMQERLEFMHSTYWNRANGLDIGGNRVEGREGDSKAGEMVLKIMDRQAKLMGVDLQPNTTTLLISAESIAAYLGWDDAPEAGTGFIDVTPKEIDAGDDDDDVGDAREPAAD
jgi:hypothetical protein